MPAPTDSIEISALPDGVAAQAADIVPAARGASNVYLTLAYVKTFVLNALTLAWGSITGTPTTLAGYGITDAAPSNATYITQVAEAGLSAEQALASLATGYVKNTTGTGVLSVQAAPIPVADGGTNATTAAGALTSLGAAPSNATYITQVAEAGLSAEQALASLATGYMKVTTGTGVISSQATPIPVADGGTGAATATANTVFSGPTSGGAAAPAFRALVAADLPAGAGAATGAAGSLFEEFTGRGWSTSNNTPTGVFEMDASIAGAGAAITMSAVPDADTIGILNISTGTTTTGRAGIFTGLSTFRFSGGAYTISARFRLPTALFDGTETGAFFLGFIDIQTSDPTDGAYLYFSNASANFRYRTRNNSTETDVDSGLAAVAGTWYYLRIAVNAAGTSVTFTVGTANFTSNSQAIATNIPTGSGRETGIGMNIIKSAGTNPRTADIDYLKLEWSMTSRI